MCDSVNSNSNLIELFVVTMKEGQSKGGGSMRSRPMVVATWMFAKPGRKISALHGVLQRKPHPLDNGKLLL